MKNFFNAIFFFAFFKFLLKNICNLLCINELDLLIFFAFLHFFEIFQCSIFLFYKILIIRRLQEQHHN